MKIELAKATREQLAQFATVNCGLDIGDNENVQAIRAKVAKVWTSETITLTDAAPQGQRVHGGDALSVREMNGRTEVRIQVHTSQGVGGDKPVPVGVNGSAMLIPRGVPVWVPEPFVEVLRNAIETHYDPVETGLGGMIGRETPSYPFSYA